MSNEKLIPANDLITAIRDDLHIDGRTFARVKRHIEAAPTVHTRDIHWATEQAYKNGYEDGKRDAFAKDNNVPSKWIPVTERLPEESGEYLVYCGEYDGICVLYYEILKTKSKWCSKWKEVTHWMPLPEPPKGE